MPTSRIAPAAAWTGAALLLVTFVCGALRIHSWPFSMYPRFDRVRTEPHQSMLEARVDRRELGRVLLFELEEPLPLGGP